MTLDRLLEYYMSFPAFATTRLSNVNQKGDFGDGPLHLAASRGVLEEIQVLLDNGADTELHGEFQSTPLHRAVLMGKPAAVKLLLKYNASPLAKDIDDKTPLDIARNGYARERSTEYREIVNMLENYGIPGTRT